MTPGANLGLASDAGPLGLWPFWLDHIKEGEG